MSKFRIYSEPSDYGARTRLAILLENADGVRAVCEPLLFKTVNDAERWPAPATVEAIGDLDGRSLLQAMMDHGWELGMRPTGVSDADTTKQIAAIKDHLADMQKLVFGPEPNIFTVRGAA